MTTPSRRLFLLALLAVLAVGSPVGHARAQIAPASQATTTPDKAAPHVPASEAEAAKNLETTPLEPASQAAAEDLTPYNPLDTYSFYLTALFIAFGLGVILLQLAAMRRIANVTADEIARNCAITLVVVASVALLVSGYSSQQVAPAFGLFGTIIGYLLGKAGAREAAGPPKPAPEASDAPPTKKV
jgi:ascorbate-specific PTS system EIIC-type component UlaA